MEGVQIADSGAVAATDGRPGAKCLGNFQHGDNVVPELLAASERLRGCAPALDKFFFVTKPLAGTDQFGGPVLAQAQVDE